MKIKSYSSKTLIISPFNCNHEFYLLGFNYLYNYFIIYDVGSNGFVGNSVSVNFKCIK